MNKDLQPLIAAIHASPTKIVLAVTGGGSRAISELLSTPGASRTVLEAVVPYSSGALDEWLGRTPPQYCSEPTARAMAMAGYLRAIEQSEDDAPIVGIGCTASLASDRPKRGAHRVHLAWQSRELTTSLSVDLDKDARSRDEEEDVVARLVLNAIGEACEVELPCDAMLRESEAVELQEVEAPESWQALLHGGCEAAWVSAAEGWNKEGPLVVFPGSFDPRHEGHRRMVDLAQQRLGNGVVHEVSIENVDKLPLDYLDLQARCGQFGGEESLAISRAATFVKKAALFPRATFLVGADTLVRIAAEKYYEGDTNHRDAAVEAIAKAGCRFLVFGRVLGQQFEELSGLTLPSALAALCDEVPEEEFRVDVSSTDLRGAE